MLIRRLTLSLTLVASALTAAGLVAVTPAAAADKIVITQADQLPRRSYPFHAVPSEFVEAGPPELLDFARKVKANLLADLEKYELRDNATLRGYHQALYTIAALEGNDAAAREHIRKTRELEEKPAAKLMTGRALEVLLNVRTAGGPLQEQQSRLREAIAAEVSAMPWHVVGDTVKQTKGQMEMVSENLVIGRLAAGIDPGVVKTQSVTEAMALQILGSRLVMQVLVPYKEAIVAGLGTVIAKNQTAKQDVWTQREITLTGKEGGSPVTIAIWDSGVDTAVFKDRLVGNAGLAFDKDARKVPDLLRPLGPLAPRWPELRGYVKGTMDLRAALDTPEAAALKKKIASLKPAEVKDFTEALSAVGMYVHGTHVAGIALAGNPYAKLYVASHHWDNQSIPTPPNTEYAARTAAAYKQIVDAFKQNGVRVVNMSWRYGPTAYETALAVNGIGASDDERKKLARQYFQVERDALRTAMASAPDILFVAGAGNESNSADFEEYIPAGLELPNLMTIGAVDISGKETSFSTFGKTVVAHANGFEVDSFVPGGDRLKLSGTSMASPQVANLAGKLLALNPKLKPAEVKQLILATAEKDGRVNLVNPKASVSMVLAKK